MRRFQYAVAVIMTAVMCLTPVLQPYAAYAEVLAAERQLYGTSDSSAAEDGAGTSAATEDGSADEGSAGEEASSSTGGPGDGFAAVEPTQPSDAGSETAGTADSAADASTEDAQVTADETADAAAEDGERDISADEFRGNSWRFENGQLIGGLDDESARSGNFRARAMNALPEGATAQGIDVSEFQYQINWDAVKASGVDFAIIRIGWWNNGVDKYFERNVAECERLGIPWGAYLYSYSMDAEDAASEANHAIDLMNQMKAKGYTPDLPVYLDLEDKEVPLDAAKLATISSTFNGKIAAAGYEPGVYASASWWKNYLTSPVFDSWSKWSAQYYSVCESPSDPDMWQYTSSGSVPGISGLVDVNYWYDDPSFTEEAQRAELDALAEENRGALADGTYAVVAGVGSRKVLDVASGSKSDGANVQIYSSNATSAQRWRVSHDGGGYVTLVNAGSGKALDVSAGRTAPGTNVQQYASNGTWSQKWVAVPDGGGFRLVSALDPRIVLDVASASSADGANVQVYTGNGSAAQRFSFVSASPDVAPCEDVLPDGWFTLSPASSPDSVADIASASSADGADARLYVPNGTLAQLFEFRYADGYYLVVNASSGKALDVADGDVVPGANVQQWTADSSNANQLFSASDNGDGTWTLVNKATGLALSASGSDLVGAAPDGSASQRFGAKEYTYIISDGVYSINSSFNSGLALEVSSASTSDGAAIQMYAANDTFSQKWLITLVDKSVNAYSIESLNSGKRLSATSSSAVGQRLPDSNDSAQLWIPNIEVGGISFVNLKYQDSILTMSSIASGKKVGLSSQSVGSPQLFTLNSSSDVVPNGTYFIRMVKNSSFVLDVDSGSKANGANVQVYTNNDSTAQKWDLTRNADGTYTICSAVSGKALDVANGSAVSGANVQQYEKNGSKAQKWYISYRDGGFVITSALNSSFVLNVDSGRTENGANVTIATSSDSHDAQRFTFASTSYVPVYRGFQNPSQYYQVSNVSVSIPHLGQGQFGYRTESRISIDATRQDCINAMVTRALEYSGTRYVWDYSCAPGVGVDCSGLVMQALYATGMDLSPMNPWDHYYTPGHDQYANYMWENGRFQKLSFSQRQPGDIIAYKGHVAIYLGNDQIVEASSPAGRVRISGVYSSPNIRGVLRPYV
ncbi:RICIN domain-containing protein [Candidatus Collinsella stercoripullorum]|uniref:RICIN domain-containing protein n=1 Tax=Candidatus Collinsella stercoripullorum TaxID=2838522 RepID=UPI0022E67F7B|nr:RICIN domain-containing protein [Candidatus Collinsella stercoripullorum]